MNPIYLTYQLKRALIQYLLTTFDVNRDGKNAQLRHAMREAFERDGALFAGPYLELSLPYERGLSINQLIEEGILSPKMRQLKNPPIPLDAPLYEHQQRAIDRITHGHSVIVSSGTGSGKTEAFLIPILNDLMLDSTPGVRAVLIYPLNALVNDQLDRLRRLLTGTGIRFGRYTSELEKTEKDALTQFRAEKPIPEEVISREAIHKGTLPQILITNYAMLEYLLLRPEDSPLFARPEAWKFIVLDEAHSYAGAKGIEVAYLIRRLKQRLRKTNDEMCCIGTSATLTDDPEVAAEFAENLFGGNFSSEDIIFGVDRDLEAEESDEREAPPIEAYLLDDLQVLLDGLRSNDGLAFDDVLATLQSLSLVPPDSHLDTSSVPSLLYGILRDNPQVVALRNAIAANRDCPLDVQSAAETVFATSETGLEFSAEQRLLALYRLIELCNYARDANGEALLPARYHVFARSPQGLWACLNPACSGRPENHSEPWSRLFSGPRLTCDACNAAVFPLVVCRTCGQVYIKTAYRNSRYESEASDGDEIRFFVWSPIETNAALTDESEDGEQTEGASTGNYPVTGAGIELCLNDVCRRDSRCSCHKQVRATLLPVERSIAVGGRARTIWVHEMQYCARCHAKSRISSDEIATAVTTSGSTPLSVLTMALYRQLPESVEEVARSKPGNGRKLLSFYDSRQGAARYAAYLQDVYNQDLYRYLVPRVLRAQTAGVMDLARLARDCARSGWTELQVFQNALDDDFEKALGQRQQWGAYNSLTSLERERLEERVAARILAEVTVSRRSRQSLEGLGLIRIRYFETPPDVSALSASLGFTDGQTFQLIDALLDTLREEKVVTLPQGIPRNDALFGQHQGNASVVRGNAQQGEVPWVGATARHRRCRIMQGALEATGRSGDLAEVKSALGLVWTWLTSEEAGVLTPTRGGAYQLALSHVFFDSPTDHWNRCSRCQRLRHGILELPCVYPECGGAYSPIERRALEEENYYYAVLSHDLYPMRVEEHTAQLSPEQGRRYQNLFKDGSINILSCSTTFEMGIDLGDLQTVVMNNVPPNVANYRQRAGRAGRRINGTAFIVTWANDRPHDQIYFKNPPEMIRGQVRVPRLALSNAEISRRHLNALLLAAFLRDLMAGGKGILGMMGPFFDPQAPQAPHFRLLDGWLRENRADLERQIREIECLLPGVPIAAESVIAHFTADLASARARYEEAAHFYREQEQLAVEQYVKLKGSERDEANKRRLQYEGLLDRLNESKLIDTLSDQGALPSYSFPIYSVELELPWQAKNQGTLRLQRDLRQAIAEYAPGSEVVADKRLWVSGGVRILRDAPQVYSYRLCPTCNHLHGARTAGEMPVSDTVCPVCRTPYPPMSLNARFLVPDGFRARSDSGKTAGQYVHREPTRQSVAVTIPETKTTETLAKGWAELQYKRDGRLFYLNEGRLGRGYRLCLKCGSHVTSSNSKAAKCPTPGCPGDIQEVHLGHNIPTDTLSVQFNPPPHMPLPAQLDTVFWYTLQTALVLGATKALQIERQDIGGTLFPLTSANSWKQSLVLYDNVPGGAGYMHDVQENFAAIVEAALQIVRCESCAEDTSCTHCLRDYGNQAYYPYLKRGSVISFLENLALSFEAQPDPLGATRLIANNPAHVLMEQLLSARQSIRLAVDSISDEIPAGENQSWLDVLRSRLRAGVSVQLLLRELPVPTRHDPASVLLADELRVMMELGDGLNLFQAAQLPDWCLLIDVEDSQRGRAFRFLDGAPRLSGPVDFGRIETTTWPAGLVAAQANFERARKPAVLVQASKLMPPPMTRVKQIPASSRKHEEKDFDIISEFFSLPIVSMTVVDPYLIDRERVVNRLGAYIRLAASAGSLRDVYVRTHDARNVEGGDRAAQSKAFEALQNLFHDISIRPDRSPNRSLHDRSIHIQRTDGSEATMYLGRGLDFIRSDGTVQATTIVIDEA